MKTRVLLLAAVAGYLAWPYAALLKLQRDLQNHDVQALQSDIDWQSVRGALKQDMMNSFAGNAASMGTITRVSTASDDLPAFGSSFATAVADNAVDNTVTPQRLADAFSTVAPVGGEAAQPAVETARFDGLASFVVKLRPAQLSPSDPPVRLSLQLVRRGWSIGWRVTRVWLPESLLRQSETHAS